MYIYIVIQFLKIDDINPFSYLHTYMFLSLLLLLPIFCCCFHLFSSCFLFISLRVKIEFISLEFFVLKRRNFCIHSTRVKRICFSFFHFIFFSVFHSLRIEDHILGRKISCFFLALRTRRVKTKWYRIL